jgi:putative restriction endonuclease
MAEPAIRRMTLEEFLRWDDGTDTRYELIDGFPVAMAPPAEAHRILAARLVSWIDAAPDSYDAEVYRRENDYWGIELVRGPESALYLASVDLRVSMFELCQGIAMPAEPAEPCLQAPAAT